MQDLCKFMASRETLGGKNPVGRLIGPALEKIIKNAAWRKHSKLVQQCKAVQDKLAALPDSETPALSSPDSCLFNGQFCFSSSDAEFILQPLLMACDTGSIKVVEPALDCLQKLIVYSHLRGEVDDDNDGNATILLQLMESICKCHDLGDEGIELAVLKTQLSAVVSFSLGIHGDYLLQIVRVCYNVFLGSRNVINQIAAKASLLQMLVTVFRRMEADSSTVPVQPIVVADLMESAERSPAYVNMLQFVQNFISKVMQDIDAVFNQSPSLNSIGRDKAFESTAAAVNGAEVLESADKDVPDAKEWETGMYRDSAKGESGDEDSDPDGDLEVQITNKLRRDAFLVFRAVCKLSMKTPPQEGFLDPLLIRGKVLSLELLKILLENAGAVFRTSQRFLAVIKQYLCLSLLKNSALPLMNVFQLSCSIFMSLVLRFRAGLKAEIGIFFPMIVLHVLEDVAKPNFYQKMIILRFLDKLCVDSQVLVDIFVNYDCHVGSPNIFERMVNGLLKTAQGVPQGAFTTLSPAEDGTFKLEAIKCLVSACRCMGVWMNQQLHIPDSHLMKISEVDDLNAETGNSGSLGNAVGEDAVNGVQSHAETATEISEAATFEQRRAYKLELQEGISLFNRKPCKGIEFLIKSNKVGSSAEEIATFLKNASGLNQTMIGDYLGEREGFALKVMYAYVDSFNFEGMEFDEAIRSFLQGFRLPGEAQKIDRIMEKFAERYCKCNLKAFTSADTAYVLAYSVIMLNTDAHNPMVKSKMSKADFIRNNRGIDDGKDLSEVYLGSLYDRIVKKEIKMKDDSLALPSRQPTNVNKILGLDNILNIVIRRRGEEKPLETSDDLIKHMQEQFKAKTGKSDSIYHTPTDVEILRFMVDVCWAPMLAAFSVTLDQSDDKMLTFQCLEGFRLAIHITAVMCMQTQRDAFVTSLAKFTSLHSAADIKQKNIDALKVIISIADEDGNHLQDAWEHILTCLSRLEHLHLLGEGAPPDASFFTAAENDSEKAEQSMSPVLHAPKRKGAVHLQHATAAAAARRGAYDSAGVGGNAPGVFTTEQMNNLVSNLNMLEQIGSFEMNRIFTRSQRLNSEAIVHFVKALCKVSMEELWSPTNPRIFSLTKIVEIAHYNMNRIRLVWSRIWNVLSNFFVTVGCSENLSVAIFVMDSLRQLAMKFLEREELANYNFQNEFMKPFVIVMRQSSSVEIRELIIRCVSQMVLVRVKNVKSGWKSMFMVFTTAASDDNRNILLLAFETIEKIVREYFPYITETETTTFTDCVNCLIAFTKNKFDKDVSLNAIAFLRFSALKLAEGGFTSSVKSKAKEKSGMAPPPSSTTGNDGNLEGPKFTDKDDHLYFWFPLLAGLSKLAFDPRPDIRKSALQVLFDTLRYHGHLFSATLWKRVFESVIFPIFDYVGHPTEYVHWREHGYHSENKHSYLEENALVSEVCPLALQLVVDLFVKFYNLLNSLLGKVLALLISFIKQRHQSLEDIGVDSFVLLISNAGKFFSEDKWQQVLLSLKAAAAETLSDFADIVYTMDGIKVSSMEEEYPMTSHTELLAGSRTIEEMEEGRVGLLQIAITEAKCCKKVQHRLVEVVMDIYNLHGGDLSAENTVVLLDVLHYIAGHAHKVNSDCDLRSKLQQVCRRGQMPDPPLLHLERESYQAYLKLLLNLARDKSTCAKEVEVEVRLVEVCEEVLQVYINTANSGEFSETCNAQLQPYWEIPLGPVRREELAFRAPLIVATLQAISGLKDTPVEKHLSRFFPLLINLVSCEHGSGEVQLALSDMFRSWIAPILLKA